MSRALISRSPDLQKLVDEGYEVDVQADHLVLHSVPYVTPSKVVKRGTLVSRLSVAGGILERPSDHVMFFAGEQPCDQHGAVITQIEHQAERKALAEGLVVDRSFSSKPQNGYADYFEKMTTYATILTAPARVLEPDATAKTFQRIEATAEESVFLFMDTASTRAGIRALTEKFRAERIGIVGVGGTGSYILDLVAKTPVSEIRLFDGDRFLNHNAFRAPGAASIAELQVGRNKAAHFRDRYSVMRRGIVAHEEFLLESNLDLLGGLTFVFVCIDRGSAKAAIFGRLEQLGVPFVDVGMGIEVHNDQLAGILRVTASTGSKREHAHRLVSFADGADDIYNSNVQVAELNALNAALAVLKWKKLRGFYRDLEKEHHATYTIDVNMMTSDEVE
ncbi:MAG TPA: ThiF family adenylyltransferase [Polyangiaceae bacterium]|jgi:hypothetical protein